MRHFVIAIHYASLIPDYRYFLPILDYKNEVNFNKSEFSKQKCIFSGIYIIYLQKFKKDHFNTRDDKEVEIQD